MNTQKTIKIKIVAPTVVKKEELPDVKYCAQCENVKPIEDFYRTGYKEYRSSRCKKCSNEIRKKYPIKKYEYVKKGKKKIGFYKLPLETQKKIQYDLYVKKSKKVIAKEYGIVYDTLLRWARVIPKYERV